MQLDENPIFRKIIISWYDSNIFCWIFIIFSTVILIFSLIGIKVALDNTLYNNYVWVPGLLGGLCFIVIVKIIIRLIRRSNVSYF
ncbi:MAG: hypothetical protein B6I26_07805 [Desulfobacteraceae bacterium 4572_130]|nr:MAG: hypothetical protein B6I26_07805 [Desulfobacteraceae bacterium 4572_130]